MPSFVTIDRSVHELFSENPRSPKTLKSVAIRKAVSDHSAVAAGRRLARPPLPAIRDLDRAPPPPKVLGRHPLSPGRHPPPLPAPGRPLATGRAQPAGAGGGGRQDTPVMASARRKTKVLTLGA